MKENLYCEITSQIDKSIKGTQARKILKLDEDWLFHAADAANSQESDFDDSAWRSLTIPHDYSIEAEFSDVHAANAYVQTGVLWYRKHFCLSEENKQDKLYLLFDGVSMNSQVWINGRFLGLHPYAYTPFWYDITPFVNLDKPTDNIIAVKADCSLQPFGRSYTGAGLFRNVWLISTYPLHIEQWGVTSEISKLSDEEVEINVCTKARVDRYPETIWNAFSWQEFGMDQNNHIVKTCQMVTSIVDMEGNIAGETQDTASMPNFSRQIFNQMIKIEKPKSWSPERPYMYTIHSKLMIDGKVVDDTLTPLGIRTIAFDANSGFSLNGECMKLKGVCLHQDSGIHGGAVPVRAWIKKLTMLKNAGCNAIRTAHHPFPAEFYHVCDYLGMMVMDEAFDEWQQGWDRGLLDKPYGKNTYGYHLFFEQWYDTDLRAMLQRDRNHPSVIMWSVGNEIPELYFQEGVDVLRKLVTICKEEDKTRPVTVCAEGNHLLHLHEGMMGQVDVAGYNYVNSREGKAMYSRIHSEHPERVLLGSETEYEPEHWKTITENPYVIGQFLWVGYDYLGEGADVLGEDSNLGFTFDISALSDSRDLSGRKILRHGWAFGLVDIIDTPKGEYFFRKSIWGKEPAVRLAVKQETRKNGKSYSYFQSQLHWNWNSGDKKTVYCFTNCEKVELFTNGRLLGTMEKDTNNPYALEWEVDYEPGTICAVGYINGIRVCEHSMVTAGQAFRIELESDCGSLKAGGRDYADITIRIVDKDGVVVPDASGRVDVRVDGCGSLLGVVAADMTSNESYRAASCNAFRGSCMAVVQSGKKTGTIDISVESEGLIPARLCLAVEA